MNRGNTLIVIFDIDKALILEDWKKIIQEKLGNGAIKKRVQELIEEDLRKFS